MFVVGFSLALILEGFMLLAGRTFLTEFVGWKNPPKPIFRVVDFGREKMVKVLGINQEIPASQAADPQAEDLINLYQSLSSSEAKKVQKAVCQP